VETVDHLLLILGVAAVTFAARLPLAAAATMRDRLRRLEPFLRHVPVAAFAAIAFPAVLTRDAELSVSAGSSYLYAAVAAVAGALVSRNLLVPVAAGVAVVAVFRLVG
jgi:branched-subunit amino acid transport protein